MIIGPLTDTFSCTRSTTTASLFGRLRCAGVPSSGAGTDNSAFTSFKIPPEGVRDYCARFAKIYYGFATEDPTPRLWSDDLIGRVEAERRQILPEDQLSERSAWRDRRLADLVVSKMKAAKTIGD